MHGADDGLPDILTLKLSGHGISLAAQRDLALYWGRRKLEGRPNDWT